MTQWQAGQVDVNEDVYVYTQFMVSFGQAWFNDIPSLCEFVLNVDGLGMVPQAYHLKKK